MNRQEAFSTVFLALYAQGKKSRAADGGRCQYRQNSCADDAVRCGIGHLIPDNLYFRKQLVPAAEWFAKKYSLSIPEYTVIA